TPKPSTCTARHTHRSASTTRRSARARASSSSPRARSTSERVTLPMQASDIAAAGGPDSLVQIPTTLGVVAVAYNLPGVSRPQIDGAALAGIYLGQIKKWNDAVLVALNPGVSLPGTAITVVHRSDGSGTTDH